MSSNDSSGSQKLDGFPLESLDDIPESLDDFDWNQWMLSIGMGG